MARKGFTLIELLVVLAIIALLATLLGPSLSNIMAMGRSSVCGNNLARLGEAFVLAQQEGSEGDMMAGMGRGQLYPRPMAWPSIPKHAVSELEIYKCPEKDLPEDGGTGDLAKMEYSIHAGKFPMDTVGNGKWYKSRRGSCAEGTYTEYIMQDDPGFGGQYAMMDFNGWLDTDGVIRVYDSGYIFAFSNIPVETADSVPSWAGAGGIGYPNRINTCGNKNDILINGEGAFDGNPRPQANRGKMFKLPFWEDQITNYGISSNAHLYTSGTGSAVLVDYNEGTIVDVDNPVQAERQLVESARHLGKVNYLTAGGSVNSETPLAISPRLLPELWQP